MYILINNFLYEKWFIQKWHNLCTLKIIYLTYFVQEYCSGTKFQSRTKWVKCTLMRGRRRKGVGEVLHIWPRTDESTDFIRDQTLSLIFLLSLPHCASIFICAVYRQGPKLPLCCTPTPNNATFSTYVTY